MIEGLYQDINTRQQELMRLNEQNAVLRNKNHELAEEINQSKRNKIVKQAALKNNNDIYSSALQEIKYLKSLLEGYKKE